jgi:hypothetical protein
MMVIKNCPLLELTTIYIYDDEDVEEFEKLL